MKTIKILFASLLVALSTSCSKENIEPNQPESSIKTITLTFSSSEYSSSSSKATINYTDENGESKQHTTFVGGNNGPLNINVDYSKPVSISSSSSLTLYGAGGGQITTYYFGNYNLYVDGLLKDTKYVKIYNWNNN
jgi:hypothetical protein